MSGLNERARLQIALLAGDDLEGEQVEEAQRSVESCPHCREHWVRVRGCLDVLDRVGKTPEPASGSSLWPAVESRLRPATVVRRSETFNGWVPALSMAAACIALMIAGQMDGVAPQDVAVASEENVMEAAIGGWPTPDAPPRWRPVDSFKMPEPRVPQVLASDLWVKEVLPPSDARPFPEPMR